MVDSNLAKLDPNAFTPPQGCHGYQHHRRVGRLRVRVQPARVRAKVHRQIPPGVCVCVRACARTCVCRTHHTNHTQPPHHPHHTRNTTTPNKLTHSLTHFDLQDKALNGSVLTHTQTHHHPKHTHTLIHSLARSLTLTCVCSSRTKP